MTKHVDPSTITEQSLSEFERILIADERSEATIAKYLRDVRRFASWLGTKPLTREAVAAWKEHLISNNFAPATVNAKLSALNALLRLLGRDDCRVRFVRVQRRVFRDVGHDLTRAEYLSLVKVAYNRGRDRLALIMETICASGIRVSELSAVTVEAARNGQAVVRCKGKLRTVLLPDRLCRKLRAYAAKRHVKSGPLFVTRSGRPLSRRQIWAEMKSLCRAAHVTAEKVFPHNLRHLFAVEYYRTDHDIVKLADVLGHSSIDTTRIYLITSGIEHRRQLDRMDLVLQP